MRLLFWLCVVIALATTTVDRAAEAQQSTRPSPATHARPPGTGDAEEPQMTTATFNDWVERCQRLRNNTETFRVCEAAQSIQVDGQSGPVAQVAIGHVKKADPLRVTLVLPVNIGFPSVPRLVVEGKPADTVELSWRRCIPGGCVADAVISDQVLGLWRAETVLGRIEAKTGAAQDVQLAFSFKGLAQALDALMKEEQ